jgi:hypothetical protein
MLVGGGASITFHIRQCKIELSTAGDYQLLFNMFFLAFTSFKVCLWRVKRFLSYALALPLLKK